jgi:hypothetical protein
LTLYYTSKIQNMREMTEKFVEDDNENLMIG